MPDPPPRPLMKLPGEEVGNRIFSPEVFRQVALQPKERNQFSRALRNGSGALVLMGSCVILVASASQDEFNTSTILDDSRVFGVTLEDVPIGAEGVIALVGLVELRVAVGTTFNQRLRQSTTAGVAVGTIPTTAGTFAIAMESRNAATGRAMALLTPSPRGTTGWILGSSRLGLDTVLG